MQPSEETLKEFEKLGIDPPTIVSHGVEDSFEHPLSEKLVRASTTNWRQVGNTLICDTEHGEFVQTIPTNQLLVGTDENGLPIFKEVVL